MALTTTLLLQVGEGWAKPEPQRSAFPGRRIGGGTRGVCTGRLLAHLVPLSSVYAPGEAGLLGVLQGPVSEPVALDLSFRPYPESGGSAAAPGERRSLPPAPAGVTLLTTPPLRGSTVWESHYRCAEGETSADPLSFVVTTEPPALSLLVPQARNGAEDLRIRSALSSLRSRCGGSVSRAEVARAFDLEDIMARGWPEQLPVRCL